MAMPRYRYAVGQAPVRFPSLKTDGNNTTKQVNRGEFSEPQAQKPALPQQKSTDELPEDQRRSIQVSNKAQCLREKAKSMYDEADAELINLKGEVASSSLQQFRLPSRAQAGLGRSQSSVANSRLENQPNETTPLLNGSNIVMQRSPKSASTSILGSSRPSSLFWTEGKADAVIAAPVRSGKPQKAYGSTIDCSTQPKDDPYGYRALAGPSLLPSYHEQQAKDKKKDQNSKRACKSVITIKTGWVALASLLAACTIACLGALYLFA